MSEYRIVETSTNDDGYMHEQGRVINGKPNKYGCKPLFELKRQKLVPLEDVLALPQAPAWSQEAPKVPGWYWWKHGAVREVVHIKLSPAGFPQMERIGTNQYSPRYYDEGNEWSPIVPPEGTR